MNIMYSRTLPPENKIVRILASKRDQIAPDTNFSEFEVNSGYGIADLMFYSLDEKATELRQHININRLKTYEILQTISLLKGFDKQKIAITEICEKLSYSQSYFESKIVPFMLKHSLITETNRGYLHTNLKYEVSLKETVAIEAKINNWRRGLYQAYRYRRYADYSYLAVLNKFIKAPLSHIDEFIKTNVGLISVDAEKNETEIIFTPKKENRLTSEVFKMYTNEFILQKMGYIS